MIVRAAVVALVVLSLFAPSRAVAGSSANEAVARDVLVVLRVLAYDRELAKRSSSDTDITVVVLNAPTQDGRADRDRWLAGLQLLPNVKVQRRKVRAVSYELDSEQGLDAALAQQHASLVIVGSGLSAKADSIRRATRARKALSFSLSESDVRRGFAVGLVKTARGDEILINVDAARSEGVRFAAGLLQIARIVDEASP